MTLAIIALAAVAMVSCSGQPKQKTGACGEPCCQKGKVECVDCPTKPECPNAAAAKCSECPAKSAECKTQKAACPAEKCAECPKKAGCPKSAETPAPATEAQPAQ